MKTNSSYPIPVSIKDLQLYHSKQPFVLESGAILEELHIGFHTYGKLNDMADNVIWVCHALTANSEVENWWEGCFGAGKMIDPAAHFVVCANILGSCYGTTSPRSINPQTGMPYGLAFPAITIRDMVHAHVLLMKHLGINTIKYAIGGSCGGHQVLEFAALYPDLIQKMVLLVTSAKETPWVIAAHEAQRMALESDATWTTNTDKAAANGLRSARAMALLFYRTFDAYIKKQEDTDDRIDDFRASSYVRYQGLKLQRRFYAHNYWFLLKALDTHNLGRGRGGIEKVLSALQQETLILSMDTDLLIPPSEQAKLAQYIPHSTHQIIESKFGHDGFLIEVDKINAAFKSWELL